VLTRVKNRFRPYLEDKNVIKKKDSTISDEVREAHEQWIDAKNYFDNVSEPELIDYATYRIEAARAKYMYLLNQLKKM
jgi:hypothetical protein